MLAECCSCDDEEAIFRKPSDGEITFDSAALVQALCINDCSNGLINIVRANMVQEFQCTGAAHLQFIERCFIEQTRILAAS